MKIKKPKYMDLADLPENKRIQAIGEIANSGKVVTFIVDTEGKDGNAKADRYMKKIKSRFPNVIELGRFPGPVDDVITIKIGLPESEN